MMIMISDDDNDDDDDIGDDTDDNDDVDDGVSGDKEDVFAQAEEESPHIPGSHQGGGIFGRSSGHVQQGSLAKQQKENQSSGVGTGL